MNLSLLVGRPGSTPEEVSIHFQKGHRVGELASALGAFLREPGRFGLALASGPLLDPTQPLAEAPLRNGDQLLVVDPGYRAPVPSSEQLELRVVGGAAAGLRLPITEGRHSLGRSTACDLRIPDISVSRAPAWLVCQAGNVALESVEARQEILVGGEPITPPCPLPPGQVFTMGSALLMAAPAPLARRPGGAGSIPFLGQPRREQGGAPAVLKLPPTPAPPGAIPLPWMRRWQERMRDRQYRDRVSTALHGLHSVLLEEAAGRRRAAPDPCDLADRARLCLPNLWERRRGDADFLRLRVGWGELPSEVQVEWPAGGDQRLVAETRGRLLPELPTLADVPLTVDLTRHRFLAVTGESQEVGGLARWLFLQAVCLHRPSDLQVAAVVQDGEDAWGWLRWLPHVGGRPGARSPLVTSGTEAAQVIARLSTLIEERSQAVRLNRPAFWDRPLLLAVDITCPGAEVLLDQLLEAPDIGIHGLILGSRAPSSIPATAELAAGRNILHLSIPADGVQRDGVPDQVSPALIAAVARDLAGIEEVRPNVAPAEPLPPGLLEVILPGGAPPPDLTTALVTQWSEVAGKVDAPLKGGAVGPGWAGIDLDAGPHAVIVGPAESGRTDLATTWMAALALRHSPRHLNLVLLGGGASEAIESLRGLPHVVPLRELPVELAIDGIVDALLTEAQRRSQPSSSPAPRLVVLMDGFDRVLVARPEAEGRIARLAALAAGRGIHLVLGVHTVDCLSPAFRHHALRVEVGGGTWTGSSAGGGESQWAPASQPSSGWRRTARFFQGGRPLGQVQIPALEQGKDQDSAIRVEPLIGADGCHRESDLARLVRASKHAAQRLELDEGEWRWRGDHPIFAVADQSGTMLTPGDGQRSRLQLSLSLEIPLQPSREVTIVADPNRSVADVLAAVTSQLGLDASSDMAVHHPRRRVWLRPDQGNRAEPMP